MPQETLLKKTFKEKDVQRLRNLITKKYGDSIQTQIGYTKKKEDHKEGDIWEENNKTWTIKNGIKQSSTKLSLIKISARMPLICPECHKAMKDSNDPKIYAVHGKCFSCVIEYESMLKREGKYQEYVDNFIKGNVGTLIDDAKDFIRDYSESPDGDYITEQGDIENWAGKTDKKAKIDKWVEELDEMKQTILKQ